MGHMSWWSIPIQFIYLSIYPYLSKYLSLSEKDEVKKVCNVGDVRKEVIDSEKAEVVVVKGEIVSVCKLDKYIVVGWVECGRCLDKGWSAEQKLNYQRLGGQWLHVL